MRLFSGGSQGGSRVPLWVRVPDQPLCAQLLTVLKYIYIFHFFFRKTFNGNNKHENHSVLIKKNMCFFSMIVFCFTVIV